MILTEFDIIYVPRKAIKDQALVDFLAAHPILDDSPLITKLSDEEVMVAEESNPQCEMYFDGTSCLLALSEGGIIKRRAGLGVIFRTPHKRHSIPVILPIEGRLLE